MYGSNGPAMALLGMTTVVLLAWVCVAAPILPQEPELSEEIRSLAGIETLEVELRLKPFEPVKARLPIERMRDGIVEAAIEREFAVTKKGADARLVIDIKLHGTLKYPGMVSCVLHLSIEQDVLVERTSKKVRVPTYALVHGLQTSKADLKADLDPLLKESVHFVLSRIKKASKAK